MILLKYHSLSNYYTAFIHLVDASVGAAPVDDLRSSPACIIHRDLCTLRVKYLAQAS